MRPTRNEDRREIASKLLADEGTFSAYFRLYDDLTRKGGDFVVDFGRERASESGLGHGDVLRTTLMLRQNPRITKKEIIEGLGRALPVDHADSELRDVVNLAVQAMVMVDSAAKDWHAADFILGGYRPTSWLPGEAFLDFLARSFPPYRDDAADGIKVALEEKLTMKAWKLQKRLGVEIRPTDNLSEHLLYEPRRNRLYLFHHVAFLKAHLQRYQDDEKALDHDMLVSLQMGTLPPQLLVETLHSLQGIIFPSTDNVSGALLDRLIHRRRGPFDHECAQYEGYKLFQDPPADFRYIYWGERLASLHGLLLRRQPRNKLERWFARQSTEGNALFIALLALLISILVGIVSIGLAIAQTYIAWMTWKYPSSPPAST